MINEPGTPATGRYLMNTKRQPRRQPDVVEILTADHHQMLELIEDIKNSTDPQNTRDLTDMVIAEIMRHSVAEEMHVYPAIREYLPDGAEAIKHSQQEHAQLVDLMKLLEDEPTEDPRFRRLIDNLEAQLRHHIREEEDKQFPKLYEHIPQEQLQELGQKVEHTKKLAQTRPHPGAGHSELFHKTVGTGLGMVDRLRDMLTHRATGSKE